MADMKVIAYASSKDCRKNHLMSAAQYESALPKNRVDFDIPLVSALSPPKVEGPSVKIKPLQWKDGVGLSTAQTGLVACYSVWDVEDEFWLCSLFDGQFPSMDAAKAAAQSDYETRILSALESSAPVKGETEGLSKLSGWDKSNLPWSEAKHKDSVCYAAFGDTWSMEDANALISFIERTWEGSGR